MKLPSCLVVCFGGRSRPPSEADSSHLSVSKGPGPSGTVRSGFLSSFMSRRSCSRGTWDYSATDAQKPRVRTRGDADVVTLATARYLELFATTPRNDETSTVLSEVQEAQDSMRSARTASDNQVSRSSTLTGRASRETSRLGSNIQPQPTQLTCLPASGSQRYSAPSHRRDTSDASYTAVSPGRDGPQLTPAHGLPGAPISRRTGSAPHVTSLGPFTNKLRRPFLARSRCRSDRISPSTAAYLLPDTSVKAIARAHTAIPATPMASAGTSSSTSLYDFSAVPVEGSAVEENASTARRPRVRACTSMSQIAPVISGGTAGVNGTGVIRTSRLQTDSGGASGSTGGGTMASTELGAAAQQRVQEHNQINKSATAALGRRNARGSGLPRRPSILFTRDGDVTVTGLPPSCLTGGRAPQCRGHADGLASTLPTGVGFNSMASVTVPSHCSALLAAGGSVDSASARLTGGQASGAQEPLLMTVFMSSRSNDPGGRSYTAASTNLKNSTSDVSLSVTQIRQQQQQRRRRGSGGPGGIYGGVSMSCGANAVFMSTDVNPDRVARCSSSGAQFEGFLGEEREQQRRRQELPQAQAQQQQEEEEHDYEDMQERSDPLARELGKQQPGTGPGQGQAESQDCHEDKRVERTRQDGSQAFVLANSSSEGGHRCEWGCSSMLAPSRFSDSSRLTHGAATATPGTASLHSNNPLYCAASAGGGGVASLPGPFGSTTLAEPPAVAAAAAASACRHTVCQVNPCPSGTMLPAGSAKPYGMLSGPSLLATEARDVTSALNRLQEACMAAVAQGDMRSQRLCRRVSTDLPRPGLNPSQMMLRSGGGGGDGFSYDRGSSMGPVRVAATLGGGVATAAAARMVGSRMGPCLRTSATLPSMDGGGGASANVQGPSALSLGVSVTLDMKRTLHSVTESGVAGGELWGASRFGGERVSPEGNGIIIDGEMLDRGHFNIPDDDLGAGKVGQAAEAGPCTPGQGMANVFDDANGEHYHNQVLNVLLQSDFLHESYEAASEDEDDGVLEYRYGGFELGGRDHDCGFVRQASFMEAVRKCGASKWSASAAGLDPGQVSSGPTPMLRSATLALATGASRHGPAGTALQRKGSCLAAVAVPQPGLT